MNNQIFEILKCLVSLVCLITGYFVIPYIKAKTYNTKYENLVKQAINIVRMLEQTKEHGDNDSKLRLALHSIVDYAGQHGVSITVEQAEILIESAVYALKQTKEN